MKILLSNFSRDNALLILALAIFVAWVAWDLGNTKAMNNVTQAERLRVYCKDKPDDAVCVVIQRTK